MGVPDLLKPQQYLAILLSWVLPPDSPYMTSIWSEGIIKWTSMTAYLPLCSLAAVVAFWRARQGDSRKRIIGVCVVFALVPVLNSAFYALNSSYYARWFYMPVLILASMTAAAWGGPRRRPAAPHPERCLGHDRHPGLCAGAGAGFRHRRVVSGRPAESRTVRCRAGLRSGRSGRLLFHL